MKTQKRERIRGLVNNEAMNKFEKNLKTIIKDLKKEGFDEDDIKEFLEGTVSSEVLFQFL